MNRKNKGISGERELVHQFWEFGWPCVRVAGSGSSRYPSPDILTGHGGRMLAIECKVINSEKKYFTKEQIEALKEFAREFGAEPYVSVKFGKTWYFFSLDDLEEKNNSYLATLGMARMKGMLIKELIGMFE